MVKWSLFFPLLGLPPPHNAVTLGHVSVRQFEVSVSHNVKLPSGKGKLVLTMHLIFHLISTNTLRDVKGEVWLVSCWKTQTHPCKSHPGPGEGVGGFPQLKAVVLGWVVDKAGSLPFYVYGSGRVWCCLKKGWPPFQPRTLLWFFTPKKARSEGVKRQGHPFFHPGNRSCIISTVHHYGFSLLSIYKMETDEFNQT